MDRADRDHNGNVSSSEFASFKQRIAAEHWQVQWQAWQLTRLWEPPPVLTG